MVRKAFLASVVLIAACAPAPAPSSSVTGYPTPTPGQTVDGNATPIASPSPAVAPELDVELHGLAPEYRPCSTELWNLGSEMVWAAYAPRHESCPDLWRYIPGSPSPELVFRSENRDAVLGPVVGARGAYAFLERSHSGVIDTGWRLWYVGQAGGRRVLLAEGESGQQAAATLTANEDRLVWAAPDDPQARPGSSTSTLEPDTSSLRVARWADPSTVETLITLTGRDGLIRSTALNGEELWYGIVSGASQAEESVRIEMLNLRDETPRPIAILSRGRDFDPAVNDGFIVYKRPGAGSAVLNWGTIVVVDRSSNQTVTVIADGNRPSIGDRFVTFDTIARNGVYVYDPGLGRLYLLMAIGDNGGVDSVSVSADLLTFVRFPEDGAATIWWGTLPH